MKEKRHFHHFLYMSRNIHDTIIATNVNSVDIPQKDGDILTIINIAAANSTGNIHQNLVMKFFILVYDLF